MFHWIKQRGAVRQAAGELVGHIVSTMPVQREERLLAGARLTRNFASTVRKIARSASGFASEQGMNVLWRAYLANRVRWALEDAGYSEEFVENIVSTIVVAMDRSRRDQAVTNA
jgi:hypothetical protein